MVANHLIKMCGLDAVIASANRALQLREAHVITRPVMADERFDKPTVLCRHVAVKKRPDMIAAQPLFCFDNPYVQMRLPLCKGKCDEASG